eukprot:scaffold108071_cov19-Tisochrysis_lutea.AAC.1
MGANWEVLDTYKCVGGCFDIFKRILWKVPLWTDVELFLEGSCMDRIPQLQLKFARALLERKRNGWEMLQFGKGKDRIG